MDLQPVLRRNRNIVLEIPVFDDARVVEDLRDGDTFEVITRFASRFALHGGPKFTPDGRYVFFGSRDGWITKYDLWRLRVVAEVRAGLNMRNVAVSGDGRWVMAANYLPRNAVLFAFLFDRHAAFFAGFFPPAPVASNGFWAAISTI